MFAQNHIFAKVAGLALVPSQFIGPNAKNAHLIVDGAIRNVPSPIIERIEKFEIAREQGIKLQGVILYPKEWIPDHQKCLVYHHPNTNTIAGYFLNEFVSDTIPFQLLQKAKCPLIMYDYRGTGISRPNKADEDTFIPTINFDQMPCINTVSTDGCAVLEYVMNRFHSVAVWGSSLGGGVATVACDAYLKKYPADAERLSLYNHDSFTSTGAVILPNCLNFIASLLNGNLDAETAMRRVVKRGVKTSILFHKLDPLIREGAQMARIAPELRGKVTVIENPDYGHAELTDSLDFLQF